MAGRNGFAFEWISSVLSSDGFLLSIVFLWSTNRTEPNRTKSNRTGSWFWWFVGKMLESINLLAHALVREFHPAFDRSMLANQCTSWLLAIHWKQVSPV